MPQELLGPSADALARLHTAEALGSLVSILRSPASKPADIVSAANSLLDRGHGRATQAIITIPARRAVATRLASLSDDQLLVIASARRVGGTPQDEGPIATGTRRVPLAAPLSKLGEPGGKLGVLEGQFSEKGGPMRAEEVNVPRGTSNGAVQQEDFDEEAHFQKLFAINLWPEDCMSSVLGSPEPQDGFATSPLAVKAQRAPSLPVNWRHLTETNTPANTPAQGGVPSERGDPAEPVAAGPHEFPLYTTPIDPLS